MEVSCSMARWIFEKRNIEQDYIQAGDRAIAAGVDMFMWTQKESGQPYVLKKPPWKIARA